jgi:hypothetical protein
MASPLKASVVIGNIRCQKEYLPTESAFHASEVWAGGGGAPCVACTGGAVPAGLSSACSDTTSPLHSHVHTVGFLFPLLRYGRGFVPWQ